MKHFVCGTFRSIRPRPIVQRLRRFSARGWALSLLTLIAMFAIPARAIPGECGCGTCRHHAGANWFCAAQPIASSLEVTEWGVRSDFICPMHSGLFGSACQCLSACSNGPCDADGPCDGTCPATCDGSCVATCDASGINGLAGLDPDAALSCDCAPSGGFLGLGGHGRFRLPGIGPRLRQRLMRKTLVYPAPSQEFVAIPCAPDSHLIIHPAGIDLAPASEVEGALPPLAEQPPVSAHSLISLPPAPVTMLLSEIAESPAPVVAVASYSSSNASSSSSRTPNVPWIDGSDVEAVESSSTMVLTSEFQPPAPVLPARRTASADTWPESSPSHLPNPR